MPVYGLQHDHDDNDDDVCFHAIMVKRKIVDDQYSECRWPMWFALNASRIGPTGTIWSITTSVGVCLS